MTSWVSAPELGALKTVSRRHVTTVADKDGHRDDLQMVHCPLRPDSVYLPLELTLRDMRTANGRTEDTGAGLGNVSDPDPRVVL